MRWRRRRFQRARKLARENAQHDAAVIAKGEGKLRRPFTFVGDLSTVAVRPAVIGQSGDFPVDDRRGLQVYSREELLRAYRGQLVDADDRTRHFDSLKPLPAPKTKSWKGPDSRRKRGLAKS